MSLDLYITLWGASVQLFPKRIFVTFSAGEICKGLQDVLDLNKPPHIRAFLTEQRVLEKRCRELTKSGDFELDKY